MEPIHSMSQMLFNQVEKIADVKTCNVDNVEQKYYKVRWKCTWEPATVLERFCGKIIDDYYKHPKYVEKTIHGDGMSENYISTDIVEKSVIDVEKRCETELFADAPNLFSQSNNLTDVQLQNVNTEIVKNSQIKSKIFIKERFEISAPNNDVLNKSLSLRNYISANNLKHHQFDPNNVTIKPEPDQDVFPNINILSESNPTTFNHREELNTTNENQNNGLISTLESADISARPCNKSNISNDTIAASYISFNQTNKLPKNCFKCQLCSYSSPLKSKFERHMQKHTGKKPFKCQLCTYSASQKSDIKRHMPKHTGEKPFKCNICSYSTSRKSSLITHMPKHTGNYPFKCSLCSYSTIKNVVLKRHYISKHEGQALI